MIENNSKEFTEQVIDAILAVVGENKVSLHEPDLRGNEWRYVKECLDANYVSSVGAFVDKFETFLADFTGAKYAVAVVNGTAALHIALKIAGVKPGDEVLVPTLTFVATANAVTYCNAEPHLVDVEEATLGIDAIKLRDYLTSQTLQSGGCCVNRNTGRIIRAIVPMHTFGHPVNLDELLSLADDFNLALIEDAAESIGSYYKEQHTGTFGHFGILSFNGNKTITAGGGGAILTDDLDVARRAKHLTTTAKIPHAWEYRHDEVGYNYRMPNLNAALGYAQLEQITEILASKRQLFNKYKIAFQGLEGVKLMEEPSKCKSNYWLQTLILNENRKSEWKNILTATNECGIMTRPAWTPMHELALFKECPQMDLSCATSLSRRIINIPSSSSIIRESR